MKKQIPLYLLVFSLFHWACEKDEPITNDESTSFVNTLSEDLSGAQGDITDYFYNFENEIEAEFFRFDPNLMVSYESYTDYYEATGRTPTIMDYRSYQNHLISMTPADEAEYTVRHYIDSLSVQDSIVPDSVIMRSTPFKNLESLYWNLEAEPSLQRYKLINSDWILEDTTLFYSDTFDISAYWAVVDTPFIDEGLLFVDSAQWYDTNYVFMSDEQIRFINNFEFTKRQLSSDSLAFRVNTDCNDNGEWDSGETPGTDYNDDDVYELLYEYDDNNSNGVYDAGDDIIEDYDGDSVYSVVYEFEDVGNGIWDPAEPYFDIDADGFHSNDEPYQDRNCNEIWNDAEVRVSSESECIGIGTYSTDADGGFCDQGNKIYDETEAYTSKDTDGDGTIEKLLYIIGDKPNNLIVDYTDSDNPAVLLDIGLGDDITDRWGNEYENLIETITFNDLKQQYKDDVDSLVTLYTKEKIGHITTPNVFPGDYYITKSNWSKTSGSKTDYYYNYHIFHEPDHLNQVDYPSFFLPLGFYYNPKDLRDGFWHGNEMESNILYYTSNGSIRDGEQVDTSYFDTTGIGVYYIEKNYNVESSSVTVPAAMKTYSDNGDGSYICIGNSENVMDPLECPAVDTTFTNCFKVTQILTMTMVGSGVEFGQKTESWLGYKKGLLKSEIHIRWTEHPYNENYTQNGLPDENNEAWVSLNRLELKSMEVTEFGSVFKKLTQPVQMVELRDLGDHPDFNFEPYRKTAQIGIQTLNLRELSE
ncbi:hypothetical protein OAR31_02410 [Candidatus Marinimicrobia bacterium]|nr:hypothetical protein [Candidatus Neomarinimicrobiota bacterium]